MPQVQLNLIDLGPVFMGQLGVSTAQVMWGNIEAALLSVLIKDITHSLAAYLLMLNPSAFVLGLK